MGEKLKPCPFCGSSTPAGVLKADAMDVDKMPAGPEMDRLIAEKVLKFKVGPNGASPSPSECGFLRFFAPSFNLSHAFEIVNALADDYIVEVGVDGSECWCEIWSKDRLTQQSLAFGKSVTLVICRAALKTVVL